MQHTSSMIKFALFGLLTLPLACSDGTVEYTNEGVREAGPQIEGGETFDTSTVEYVLSNADLQSRLAGSKELIWRPARAFSGVVLHMSAKGLVDLEYASENADGTRSVFRVAQLSDAESEDFTVSIPMSEPARGLILRVNEGAESINFIRAEFMHEVGLDGHVHSDDDIDIDAIDDGTFQAAVSRPGRYRVSQASLDRASQNPPRRDSAPAWSARMCRAGDFNFSNTRPGARALADYIRENFEGVRSIGGFGCRQNTNNRSRLSVHGTGRALDVMLPLSNGQADNDLGDAIAEFVIANATEIGVQTVIWDNTIWSSRSPTTDRFYGNKPNVTLRHEDHLHIEVNIEGGEGQTPWFSDRSVAVSPPANGGGTGAVPVTGNACSSRTLGRQVSEGESVQMNYTSGCGSSCSWATCNNGSWDCTQSPATTNYPHSACSTAGDSVEPQPQPQPQPQPSRSSCFSRTLNRSVDDGVCVQMSYSACGGTCKYAECQDGAWSCTPEASCGGEKIQHTNCAATNGGNTGGNTGGGSTPTPTGAACPSRTLGMTVPAGSCVQMSYDACGGTCQFATCQDGEWACGGDASSCAGQAFPHNACSSSGGNGSTTGSGSGPAPGPSRTVEQLAAARGCTSSVVNGLSRQLIEELNCMEPGLMRSFAGQSNLRLGGAVFPYLQSAATGNLLRAINGTSMGINSALRTIPQQYLLWRWQGSCGISIAARPGRSNHNGGLAIDTSDYNAMRSRLESNSWSWFGSRDRPHFSHSGRDIRSLSVLAFQKLWNRNNPNDRIAEDGGYGNQTEVRLKSSPSNGFAQGASCGGARSGNLPTQSGLLVEKFDLDILGPSLRLNTIAPARVHAVLYAINGIEVGLAETDGETEAFELLAQIPSSLLEKETLNVTATSINEEGEVLGESHTSVTLAGTRQIDATNWGWGSFQVKIANPPADAGAINIVTENGEPLEMEFFNPEDLFDVTVSLRQHQSQRPIVQILSKDGDILEEHQLQMSFEMWK